MIIEFKEDKINDIAEAQVLAWKAAFEGILGEKVLSTLAVKKFAENWKRILDQKERKNYIWIDEFGKGLGFISFGKPKDKNESASIEIYGIYVHPDYWGKEIGYKLMVFAINSICQLKPSAKIVLWTMNKNKLSKKFYNRFGFRLNGNSRTSRRNDESFDEVQFEL